MRLFAIADLHISYKFNEDALRELRPHPEDGIIVCGDIGEKLEHLRTCFDICTRMFAQVFWVPGNHELYTLPGDETGLRGELKYKECLSIANEHGVITPEDEYVTWQGEGGPCIIAPVFTLYDTASDLMTCLERRLWNGQGRKTSLLQMRSCYTQIPMKQGTNGAISSSRRLFLVLRRLLQVDCL